MRRFTMLLGVSALALGALVPGAVAGDPPKAVGGCPPGQGVEWTLLWVDGAQDPSSTLADVWDGNGDGYICYMTAGSPNNPYWGTWPNYIDNRAANPATP